MQSNSRKQKHKTIPVWNLYGIIATAIVLITIILSGCPGVTEDPPVEEPNTPTLSTEKEITSFSFESPAVTGTITGTDIALTVPFGTTVTALVPTFTSTGSAVTVGGTAQISGTTVNDFTSSVTYTVTAEDTTTVDYTVTVTIAAAVEDSGFDIASDPGDSGTLTLVESLENLIMIYSNNSTNITFPTKKDDTGTATLTTKFWLSETEVTNSVVTAVFQWAYDNGRFSDTVGNHNGLDITTAKHGNQQLLDLDFPECRVNYDGSGNFSTESSYGDNPVTNISWYGAVIFCNWLTEMRDGNTANLVYANINTDWDDGETTETVSNSGYRLPSSDEWEYAARYLGTTAPSTGDSLDTERKYGNLNPAWTDGFYWTPGNYASGATSDYNNTVACSGCGSV